MFLVHDVKDSIPQAAKNISFEDGGVRCLVQAGYKLLNPLIKFVSTFFVVTKEPSSIFQHAKRPFLVVSGRSRGSTEIRIPLPYQKTSNKF